MDLNELLNHLFQIGYRWNNEFLTEKNIDSYIIANGVNNKKLDTLIRIERKEREKVQRLDERINELNKKILICNEMLSR
jgi:hypothetical protein